MAFRVSFFFSAQVGKKTGGWSTNFWNNASDLSAVQTAAVALAKALLNLTGYGVAQTAIRIQDLSSFRAVQLLDGVGSSAVIAGNTANMDYPTTALLMQLQGPAKYVARYWLRGIPDSCTDQGGVFTPPAFFSRYLNQLASILTSGGNGWVIRSQDKGQTKTLITAATAAGVITAPAHGLATQDTVRIARTHGIAGLNKIWKIQKVDNDTFQLLPATAGMLVGTLTPPPGTVQKQVPLYQGIFAQTPLRISKHNVGRPFGLLVGRRKRRAS